MTPLPPRKRLFPTQINKLSYRDSEVWLRLVKRQLGRTLGERKAALHGYFEDNPKIDYYYDVIVVLYVFHFLRVLNPIFLWRVWCFLALYISENFAVRFEFSLLFLPSFSPPLFSLLFSSILMVQPAFGGLTLIGSHMANFLS